jgi:hypothetical protein
MTYIFENESRIRDLLYGIGVTVDEDTSSLCLDSALFFEDREPNT